VEVRKRQQNGYRTRWDGSHQRAFEPKAHTINNKSRCPVEFYKAFRGLRSDAMLERDAPFNFAINHQTTRQIPQKE